LGLSDSIFITPEEPRWCSHCSNHATCWTSKESRCFF